MCDGICLATKHTTIKCAEPITDHMSFSDRPPPPPYSLIIMHCNLPQVTTANQCNVYRQQTTDSDCEYSIGLSIAIFPERDGVVFIYHKPYGPTSIWGGGQTEFCPNGEHKLFSRGPAREKTIIMDYCSAYFLTIVE